MLTWLYPPGAPLRELVEADVDVSLAARWAVDEVVAAARAAGRTARVHLAVDTGLGRNGIMPADLPDVLDAVARAEAEGAVRVVGMWSHLAFADEPGHPTVVAQADVLDEAVREAARAGVVPELRHLANSAATLTAPARTTTSCAPAWPRTDDARAAARAAVAVRPAPRDDARGAPRDGQARARRPRRLLLAPLHDAAGHDAGRRAARLRRRDPAPRVGRRARGRAGRAGARRRPPGEPGGRVVRVAGRVCMDQLVLDLGPGATERAGDVVTLFGAGDGVASAGIPTAEDWAQAAGTISYEITTRLGARVPREHVGSTCSTTARGRSRATRTTARKARSARE